MGGFFLSHLEDADRLRSAEFAWAICDELTECTRDDFGRILYSIRSAKALPWMPFVGASNPDGTGHAWVRKIWLDRDFRAEDSEFNPDDFLYIPALPTDNPTWTDDMASSQFAGLSHYVRIARLTGSWDVIGNARFPTFDRKFHVFNARDKFPMGIPTHWRKYRAVDYGFGVPFCCLWAAMDGEGNFWIYRELYEKGLYAWEQAQKIREYTSEGEKIELTYAGKDFWSSFPGHQGRTDLCPAKYYLDAGIPLIQANNERISGWVTLENYLDPKSTRPNVFISDECQNLVRTLASLPLDTRSPILEKKGDTHPEAEDHAPEALRYLLHTYHYPATNSVELPGINATQQEKDEFRKYSDNELAKYIKKQTDRSFRDSILKKTSRKSYRGSWPRR